MYMLVKIGHFVIIPQLSGSPVSYLSQQLGNCLISVKRLFDKFIVRYYIRSDVDKFENLICFTN